MKKPIESVSLSVVVPIYNEEKGLGENLREIRKHVARASGQHEFILIDDGSTDRTWEILGEIEKHLGRVTLVRFCRNFGKEAAICAGLDLARGDAVVVMDADLQHDPELIPPMVAAWKDGDADIVEAVKVHRGAGPKLRNKLFYWIMRRLTGFDMKNACDFKLMGRRVVDTYNRIPEKNRFFRGLTVWTGFRRVQLPMPLQRRASGRSKWSLVRLLRLGAGAVVSFSSIPLHLITLMGAATLFGSLVLTIFSLYMKFSGRALTGFSTVIILILFIGSTLMISLGIIGLYLGKIYDEIKKRPAYVVDEIRRNGEMVRC